MPTDNRHPRILARCSIMADPRLSFAARCLYHLLDDLAFDGICRAKQTTLSVRLQIGRQHIVTLLQELATAGHVIAKRGQRGKVYLLRWAEPFLMSPTDDIRCSPQATSEPPPPLYNQSSLPGSREEFSTTRCYRCGNTGSLGENYLGESIPCDCRRLREVG